MIKLNRSIGQNFCYAPWTNIHVNPQGTYKTCCGGLVEIADLRIASISDIIDSPQLIEIKEKILQNEVHKNCHGCIRQEQMSSASERSWYDDISKQETIEITDISSSHIQNLDIRWSNTCNLSCTYCGHDASSQWANIKNIPVERLDYSKTITGITDYINQNKKSIKNLGLLGGEPLLQKENNLLLDVIDQDVNINLITNLSVPLENNKIFQKLLTKNKVVWDISFDTVEEKFEYVRHGASWQNQLNNIRLLQNLIKDKPGHIIGVAAVYSIYNALELESVHEYFRKNNLPNIRWNELNHPSILSVASLPERFRSKAAEQLEKSVNYHTWPRQKNFLLDMAKNLRNISTTTENCETLYKWHEEQENNYWPDFKHKFSNLWPEYRG